MAAVIAKVWSALSLEGSESVFPSEMDLCLSYASFMRLTRTRAGGRQSVPDLTTSHDSGSWRLGSPNLSATKGRDLRTHLEPERNLVVDRNAIALKKLNLVSPMVGANYRGLRLDLRLGVLTNVKNNGTQGT
jgi:hypothetical protein